jgi:hypothetical protein
VGVACDWEPGFSAHRGQAKLRVAEVSIGDPSGNVVGRWQRVVQRNHDLGRIALDVEYGTWSGHLIEAVDVGLWCRCWLLRATAGEEIEVTYSCPQAEAGRDDPAIEAALRSLAVGARAA